MNAKTMAKPMRAGRVLFLAAAGAELIGSHAPPPSSGRAHKFSGYGISKGQADLRIAVTTATNSGITGFQAIDSATIPQVLFGQDFPGKRIQVLHNEPADRFELMTDLENINTPRYQNQINSKILTLN